ncbi:unnamed protein product [Rotaria magnacalcarata]|nr:unnamed protein product [Rotaria magnacalcarata]CAF4234598.1 unnamed protein product [Rotaria magnacalcarata]
MSHWPHATAQLSRDRSDGVDSLFSTPSTTKWKAFDREAALSSDDCMWSIVRCILDSQEELTLTLTARSASFITYTEVEHISYMKQPAKPEEIDTELQRMFVLYLPCERYAGRDHTADDYPIIIHGRQRQIADLSIDELYRLTFTCSLFPGERSLIKSNNSQQSPATALTNCSSATDSDKLPHNQILHFLLTIEKTFQSESETIAREQFAPNSRAMIKMNQILLNLNYDDDNTDESENSNHDVQVCTELVLLEDVLDQWKNGPIAKSMNAIALGLSMLTAIQMAFHKTLKITTNRPTWWWV